VTVIAAGSFGCFKKKLPKHFNLSDAEWDIEEDEDGEKIRV